MEKKDRPQDRGCSQPSPWSTAASMLKPSLSGISREEAAAMLVEAGFMISAWGIWKGLGKTIEWIKPGFEAINLNKEALAANPALAEQAMTQVRSILAEIGLATAAWAICLIAVYCLSNSLIWALLERRRPDIKWISRWIKTEFLAAASWAAILAIIIISSKPEWYSWLIPAWSLAAAYWLTSLHITLTTENEASGWRAASSATKTSILEPMRIVWPTAIWLAFYIPLTIALGAATDMTDSRALAPYLIIMTVWLRRYILLCHRRKE